MQSSVEFLPTINAEFTRISGVNKPVNCLHLLYATLYAFHLHIINHLPQIEISNDWELPKTTVNTVIKDIQKDGYALLVPIKGKRREMSIVLTESGKKFADDVLSELYKKEEKTYKSLTAEEQEIVMVLEKLARKLNGDE